MSKFPLDRYVAMTNQHIKDIEEDVKDPDRRQEILEEGAVTEFQEEIEETKTAPRPYPKQDMVVEKEWVDMYNDVLEDYRMLEQQQYLSKEEKRQLLEEVLRKLEVISSIGNTPMVHGFRKEVLEKIAILDGKTPNFIKMIIRKGDIVR